MPNYDEKTGISYGVISPHAINQDSLSDIYDRGTDPHYENAKESLMDDIKSLCDNHGLDFEQIDSDSFIDEMNNHYESCGDGQCDYSDNEYTLHVSGDNFGIYVIKSPYYTYCRKCSPCAPGAGDLNTPLEEDQFPINGDKTYCLGPEYFNEDSPIAYRVFRVLDDTEVIL